MCFFHIAFSFVQKARNKGEKYKMCRNIEHSKIYTHHVYTHWNRWTGILFLFYRYYISIDLSLCVLCTVFLLLLLSLLLVLLLLSRRERRVYSHFVYGSTTKMTSFMFVWLHLFFQVFFFSFYFSVLLLFLYFWFVFIFYFRFSVVHTACSMHSIAYFCFILIV